MGFEPNRHGGSSGAPRLLGSPKSTAFPYCAESVHDGHCVRSDSRRKDVNHEICDACGFDGARYDDASLLESLRTLGPRWRALLAAAGPELRVRPEPEVWSAIEYAAHSRDITALHVYGVEQALTRDEPVFPRSETIWSIRLLPHMGRPTRTMSPPS